MLHFFVTPLWLVCVHIFSFVLHFHSFWTLFGIWSSFDFFIDVSLSGKRCPAHGAEVITIRFAGWIYGRIVCLQLDKDIQKLLSNGNRIRISETLLSIFRGFRLLEKVAHCTIIHLLSSEASFQPPAPWLQVCLWCNLWTVELCQVCQHESVPGVARWGSLLVYIKRMLFAAYLD